MTPKQLVFATTKKELLDLDVDDNSMVALTPRNSGIIETLISRDPAYPAKAKTVFDGIGKKTGFTGQNIKDIIYQIADDNSTHTAIQSRNEMAAFISSLTTCFLERLKGSDYGLVDEINDHVFKAVALPSGRKAHVLSLASKLCRYLEEWIYGSDNFTINDSFVRKLLPYYVMKCGGKTTINLEKSTYQQFMGEFLKITNTTLSKHSIDHIIWYSYKDDPIRTAIGVALSK